LNVTGLRHSRLKRFPYLVFYFDGEEHVDVWRVLHEKRAIATWLSPQE